MSDYTQEDWTNHATWYVNLELRNNAKFMALIKTTAQHEGAVSIDKLKAIIKKHIKVPADVMAVSTEKGICYNEICSELEQYYIEQMNYKKEKPVKIEDTEVLAVISGMIVENNTIKLSSGKLDRAMYVKVDKILKSMGGKWNKKAEGHLFKENPEGLLDYLMLHNEAPKIAKPEKFGEFFTPENLARKAVYLAGLNPGEMVLEPSAGQASLAWPIAKIVGIGNVKCIEIQEKNVKFLHEEGFMCREANFLEIQGKPVFPKIVMNPPFEKQADIDHVMHAYSHFLKPGGRLVAIMASSVKWRENKKTVVFRDIIEAIGGSISTNPEGSFKESGTMVGTVIVIMDKP